MKKTVVILHSNWIFRSGLKSYLNNSGHFETVFETDNTAELIDWLNAGNPIPAMVFISSSLVGLNGFNTAELFRQNYPDVLLIAICPSSYPDIRYRMIKAGCNGCINSNDTQDIILHAINDLLKYKFIKNKEEDYVNASRKQWKEKSLYTLVETIIAKLLNTDKTTAEISLESHHSKRCVERISAGIYKTEHVKNRYGFILKTKEDNMDE